METEFIIDGRTGIIRKENKEEFVVITRTRAISLLTRQVTTLGWHQFSNKELLVFLEDHYSTKKFIIKSRLFIRLFLGIKIKKPPLSSKENQKQYARYRAKADNILLNGLNLYNYIKENENRNSFM